ncbi:MAG: hypothetical protein HYV27_15660 [Candidatus Hydrogenedentes bacterium]|nr:hypothetical protein [Candidatus Hydrogenedentota bacterium]
MRLYEYEAKQLLARAGFSLPVQYGVADRIAAAEKLPLQFPVMVKAQVLIGGRGKAGGIRKAENKSALRGAVKEVLAARISGHAVERVLLEAAVPIERAFYLGVAMNPVTCGNTLIVGLDGGVDIEEAARKRPDSLFRAELPLDGGTLPPALRRDLERFLAAGVESKPVRAALAEACAQLFQAFVKYDCTLLEINPLVQSGPGLMAADAKAVLDNNALYRQSELLSALGIAGKRHDVSEPTAREQRASKAGFAYVDLLPEDAQRESGRHYVGLVPGGAGYGIFSIDEVQNIGGRIRKHCFVPLNFMDSGGGPTREAVKEMFALILDHPLVDVIVTSRFGGISSCDIYIQGLVACLRERAATGARVVPIHGRMVGTDLPAARAFLEQARQQTPGPLAQLHLAVGNERIMAEAIREGLTESLRQSEGAWR